MRVWMPCALSELHFKKSRPFCVFEAPLGDLGATYDDRDMGCYLLLIDLSSSAEAPPTFELCQHFVSHVRGAEIKQSRLKLYYNLKQIWCISVLFQFYFTCKSSLTYRMWLSESIAPVLGSVDDAGSVLICCLLIQVGLQTSTPPLGEPCIASPNVECFRPLTPLATLIACYRNVTQRNIGNRHTATSVCINWHWHA